MPVWMGGIFLKDEGGYEIVLKSLTYYKKRLQTIHASPELKEAAAMFAPVLQGQAQKRIPLIDEAKQKIDQMLKDSISPQSLEQDLEIFEKLLASDAKVARFLFSRFLSLFRDFLKIRCETTEKQK